MESLDGKSDKIKYDLMGHSGETFQLEFSSGNFLGEHPDICWIVFSQQTSGKWKTTLGYPEENACPLSGTVSGSR